MFPFHVFAIFLLTLSHASALYFFLTTASIYGYDLVLRIRSATSGNDKSQYIKRVRNAQSSVGILSYHSYEDYSRCFKWTDSATLAAAIGSPTSSIALNFGAVFCRPYRHPSLSVLLSGWCSFFSAPHNHAEDACGLDSPPNDLQTKRYARASFLKYVITHPQ